LTLLDEAVELHKRGELEKARDLYAHVLKDEPENADALALSGVLASCFRRYDEALDYLNRAIALDEGSGLFRFYLGNVHRDARNWAEAADAYEKAVALQPFAMAYFFLGLALNRCGRDEEALAAYRHAIDMDSKLLEAIDNAALTLQILGRQEEAVDVYHQLLHRSGQAVDDESLLTCDERALGPWHHHLALLELRLGDYRRGFARYRSRFALRSRPSMGAPVWRGEDLKNKKILVYAEQGLGDDLMLYRYVPMLAKAGAKVFLHVPSALARLFATDQVTTVLAQGERMPEVDFVASFFDLPFGFATTCQDVPLPCLPWVEAKNLDLPVNKKKIGVVWAGNPRNGTDALRSLPLEVFAPLFRAKDCAFYSFGKEVSEKDMKILAESGVVELGSQLGDFADTASLAQGMDVIVTCDTSMAHLAGGLGKKVWVLLPFDADWRWGLVGDTCPWYPSARLFRQKRRGDWAEVVERVLREILAL
jgi:tetratricopeptide (TPR) repeat protein